MVDVRSIRDCDLVRINRRAMRDAHVLGVRLCGDAGAGKTTLLEETLCRLSGRHRAGVIIANPKADRDARQLAARASAVVAVRTAALDASQLHEILCGMHLDALDVLFIETIATLPAAAAPMDLGQDVSAAVFSVSGGDDKAAEFPRGVAGADLVLLNKLDLLPHVRFDTRVFERDVRRLNLDAPVLHVSARHGTGMDRWDSWLRDRLRRVPRRRAAEWREPPELFLG